jgi:hypothetical protein
MGTAAGDLGKARATTAYTATAQIHNLVLVTRNVKHVVGRDVRVLDHFAKNPVVKTV